MRRPLFSLSLIVLAVLGSAGCTLPGAAPGTKVTVVRTSPVMPAGLHPGEPLYVTIAFANPAGVPVNIFARPGLKGDIPGGSYAVHSSPRITETGGEVVGWFRYDREFLIDAVIVEMRHADTRALLAQAVYHQPAVWRQ